MRDSGRDMATKAKKSPDKRQKPKKPAEGVASSSGGKKTASKSQSTKKKPSKHKAEGDAADESAGRSQGRKAPDTSKGAEDAEKDDEETRQLGLRGAAPWAARHAAKHAAEARARAAEPPPPGSARATLREPSGAEEIKVRVIDLHNKLNEIKTLRKNLSRNFFAIGLLLQHIRDEKLYEARGFGSFEAFLDREVEIGKTTSLRLTRVVAVFQEEAAAEYGMDRVLQALATLESGRQSSAMQSTGTTPAPLPLRPPIPKK